MGLALHAAVDSRGGERGVSIVAYVGLPGSGKTLGVVEHVIMPALKAGRHVVTNVAMNWDVVADLRLIGTLDELPTDVVLAEPSKLFEYAQKGCVLVLDEVWRFFPAGVKASKVPEEFRTLLAEHRHMVDDFGNSLQVCLVTQDLAQIGSFARQLVETTFRFVKLSSLGASSKYRLDVFNGPVTGPNPPESRRSRQIFGSYNKKTFRLYRSHTQSQSAEGGANEKSVDRRFIVWRSPVWWLGGPAVVALFGVCVWRVFAWFGEPPPAPRAASVASSERVPVRGTVERSVRVSAASGAGPQADYRVVGWVSGERGNTSAAIRAAGVVVYVDASRCWQPGDGLMHCSFGGFEVTEISSAPLDARVAGER